jgi:hypothetical protein
MLERAPRSAAPLPIQCPDANCHAMSAHFSAHVALLSRRQNDFPVTTATGLRHVGRTARSTAQPPTRWLSTSACSSAPAAMLHCCHDDNPDPSHAPPPPRVTGQSRPSDRPGGRTGEGLGHTDGGRADGERRGNLTQHTRKQSTYNSRCRCIPLYIPQNITQQRGCYYD